VGGTPVAGGPNSKAAPRSRRVPVAAWSVAVVVALVVIAIVVAPERR
jgi:hypothetical protein